MGFLDDVYEFEKGYPLQNLEAQWLKMLKDPLVLYCGKNNKKYYTYEDLRLMKQAIKNTLQYYLDHNIDPDYENAKARTEFQKIKEKELERQLNHGNNKSLFGNPTDQTSLPEEAEES